MQKLPLLILILIGLYGCATKTNKRYASLKGEYKTVASQLVELIKTKNPSKGDLIRLSEKTMNKAKPILREYSAMYPQCTNLVDFMIKNEKAMKNLTPSAIEKDYHDGGALPTFADECHDIKEILVHPATVISLAKYKTVRDSKEQMFDEMEEVLLHLDTL